MTISIPSDNINTGHSPEFNILQTPRAVNIAAAITA